MVNLRERIAMINVVAFEEQSGFKYSAIVSLPFLIIIGTIFYLIDVGIEDSIYILGSFGIVVFMTIHLTLKRIVKRSKERYGHQISKNYTQLRKQEFLLIIGVLGISFSMIGLAKLVLLYSEK
jgi:hypothetical protein